MDGFAYYRFANTTAHKGKLDSTLVYTATTTFDFWRVIKLLLHTCNLHKLRIHWLKRRHRSNYLDIIYKLSYHSWIGSIIKRITWRKKRQKKQKCIPQQRAVHTNKSCSVIDYDLCQTEKYYGLLWLFLVYCSNYWTQQSPLHLGLITNMEPFRFLLTICPIIGDDEPHVPIPAGSEYLPHARVPIELQKAIMTHLHVSNNRTLGGIQEGDAHLQITTKNEKRPEWRYQCYQFFPEPYQQQHA